MKVPYLKEKQRGEMIALASEFSTTIGSIFEQKKLASRLKTGWLSNLYPVFALFQVLLGSQHNLNPSREYALEGAKGVAGSEELFLQAINTFQAPPAILEAMRNAYSATIFSGFIQELRSDLLMVFIQGLMYSYRGAAISLRCCLEDLYRHLFYMDHIQEYTALREERASEHSMKINPIALREYLGRASYLQCFSSVSTDFSEKPKADPAGAMDYFGLNEQLYGALSAAVHGASDSWFAALANADSLKESAEREAKLEDLCSKFSKMCVAFLIAAHRDLFSSLGDYDKSIVLDLYTLQERKNLRSLLNL